MNAGLATEDHVGRAERFRRLHDGPAPLRLVNAWDRLSARVFRLAGAPAVATSSSLTTSMRGMPVLLGVVLLHSGVTTRDVHGECKSGEGNTVEDRQWLARRLEAAARPDGSAGGPCRDWPAARHAFSLCPGAGGSPASWPEELLPVFTQAVTAEYTSLTRDGAPVMVPTTPFADDGAGSLDVSTGLAFPAKAERARRNPKVCLLYADPVGSGLADPLVVLVQGLATVCDADLQANTDRYVRSVRAKTPDAFKGMPKCFLRRLDWYFARIWIQVTPTRMWWWRSKSLDAEPGEWAGSTPVAPSSDPAPPGKQPPAWLKAPADWRTVARASARRLGHPDLSWVGPDGFPLAVPVRAEQTGQGFRLRFGPCLPGVPQGRACLTFHSHPPRFTGQENHSFVGDISAAGLEGEFCVDRLLPDVSLTGNRLTAALGFLGKGRQLAPRLHAEAARRGQSLPRIRLPRPD